MTRESPATARTRSPPPRRPSPRPAGSSRQERYTEAVAAYVDALSKQPGPAQTREAIDGINRAVALQKQSADAGSVVARQLAERLAEIETLRQEIASRDARIDEARGQIEQLQASLQELSARAAPDLQAGARRA